MRGKFITFEGSEGTGKSTQIRYLEAFLQQKGLPVLTTREPGGSPLGETMRTLLLTEEMDAYTELLLMFAARREHWVKTINPALEQGIWVISDRFTDSSYAYQGAGRGIPSTHIEMLETLILKGNPVDLTLWFDLPIEEGLKRAKARSQSDRFETEALPFFVAVNQGFQRLAEEGQRPIQRIDASQTIEAIAQAIQTIVSRHFSLD